MATSGSGTATVRVTVLPGALAASTDITVTEISNTAPGGVGSAWRIGPEGLAFATPVTLTFKPGVPVDTLGVSSQASGGYWLRRRDVTRDALAGTVSVTTDHFSDWAVTTGSSSRDLQGTVSITSTVDIPATVSGSMTLDYAGDGDGNSYYILGGTLRAPASLIDGTSTCTPNPVDFAVRANLAELHPTVFLWGTSGVWPMSCTGPGGGSSQTLTVAFDNGGYSYPGCARDDLIVPVVTASQVQGQYRIDCGSRGTVTATWNFVTCASGTACEPTSCTTGTISCATAMPSCVQTGNQPDGTACGPQAADICSGGNCSTCTAGAACGAPTVCQTSATDCSTNPATCAILNMPDGTSCGPQAADICSGGNCSTCTAGAACGAPTVCQTSATDCSTSPATCTILNMPDGTSCGPQAADICSGGNCSTCTAGAACGAPTVCQTSATDCSTNPASCTIQNKPDGTSCGPQAADICSGGNCSTCTAGAACGAPTVCQTSATDCTTSPASCTIQNKLDGTSCGPQAADTCSGGTARPACLAPRAVRRRSARPRPPTAPPTRQPARSRTCWTGRPARLASAPRASAADPRLPRRR